MTTPAAATLSVREAAELLGRDRTRVYALLRSGDRSPCQAPMATSSLLIDRSSVERWAVAGGSPGGPLTPRNAWAIIGLASGDELLSERCLGLLETARGGFQSARSPGRPGSCPAGATPAAACLADCPAPAARAGFQTRGR